MNTSSETENRKRELVELTRGPVVAALLVCLGFLVLSHFFEVLLIIFTLVVSGSALGLIVKPNRYPNLRRFVFAKAQRRSPAADRIPRSGRP